MQRRPFCGREGGGPRVFGGGAIRCPSIFPSKCDIISSINIGDPYIDICGLVQECAQLIDCVEGGAECNVGTNRAFGIQQARDGNGMAEEIRMPRERTPFLSPGSRHSTRRLAPGRKLGEGVGSSLIVSAAR